MRLRLVTSGLSVAFGFLTLWGIGGAQAQEMPKTVAQAIAMEEADRLPFTDLYSTPANFPATKPGELMHCSTTLPNMSNYTPQSVAAQGVE